MRRLAAVVGFGVGVGRAVAVGRGVGVGVAVGIDVGVAVGSAPDVGDALTEADAGAGVSKAVGDGRLDVVGCVVADPHTAGPVAQATRDVATITFATALRSRRPPTD